MTGLSQSWVSLKAGLKAKFDTEHSRWKRRHQVHARKQLPSEAVSAYIQNMRELFSSLNQTEEEQIQVFTDNLREELRKFVYSKTVHSLDEAEEVATLGESLYSVGGNSAFRKEINQLTKLLKSLKPIEKPKKPDPGNKDISIVLELVQSLTQDRGTRTVDGRPKCFNCNRPGIMAHSCKTPRQT